ncbi:MAG TPA: acetate uptake transporter [Ktedonobacteraceae bacterium]|nr:acetate uptake transporter [Ktedonobacteraceae bacterium]
MAQIAAERSESAAATTANPAPLGLSAFALTTFVLSSANAGLFKGGAIVLGLALFYGGLVQLLAGLQEFKAGNTFGATAFCSYGGFWLAYGAILIPAFGIVTAYGGDTPAFHTAAGYFLLGWTIFTGFMFLGTLRTNLALMGVFGFLFLTFLALAIGELAGATAFGTLGGWLGIITAIVAWYAALAGVLASHKSMFTLPTWPRS